MAALMGAARTLARKAGNVDIDGAQVGLHVAWGAFSVFMVTYTDDEISSAVYTWVSLLFAPESRRPASAVAATVGGACGALGGIPEVLRLPAALSASARDCHEWETHLDGNLLVGVCQLGRVESGQICRAGDIVRDIYYS
jgi:hypothetical protein